MMRVTIWCAALAAAVSLTACGPAPEAPKVDAPAPAVAPAPLATDAWIGEWIGVEGNTLNIQTGPLSGDYNISERQLDGPINYTGHSDGATIVFQDKDMRSRTIRAGTGEETGLKYLAGKTNCLVIESGRGFCR